MAVVIIYWDSDYHVENLGLIRCLDATASGLFNTLISLLNR